jgi:predicted DNA binding CopG/RHH family protein
MSRGNMTTEKDDLTGWKHVQVRLNSDEYKALKSQAHKAEMALQPFVRKLIVAKVVELEARGPASIKAIRKPGGK